MRNKLFKKIVILLAATTTFAVILPTTLSSIDNCKMENCRASSISTIGDVMGTFAPSFPTSRNNAWENENGCTCYLKTDEFDKTYITIGNDNEYTNAYFDQSVTEDTYGYYYYESFANFKTEFHIENNELKSIVVSGSFTEEQDGTYLPHTMTIADVIATVTNFPSSNDAENTWIYERNVCCYYNDELFIYGGVVTYTIMGNTEVTQDGDNYTCEYFGTLVFEMVDGVLDAITYTPDEPCYMEVAGRYKEGFAIHFEANDPTMGQVRGNYGRACEGMGVRIYATPNQGCYFDRFEADYDGFEVLTDEHNFEYFVMPDHAVTITGYFASNTVTGITMKTTPTKTEYVVGEELDLTGAKITVTLSSGETQDIDVTSDMVSGFNSSEPGEQTITVTYEGQSTSFTVKVVKDGNKDTNEGLNPGAVAGITIGAIVLFFIILFAVLYILWKVKDINVLFIKKFLTPAFRWLTNLLFKTKLNNVEKKDAEEKQMSEEDYLKALKEGTLNK